MFTSDILTIGVLDYPVTLFFCFLVALVQLVAAVNLCFFTATKVSLRWFGRLVGELDVSNMVWTLSKGPKESYKYDLANSLVPLITLSLDHQNHSEWPKWGHVRYSLRLQIQALGNQIVGRY